MSTTATTADLKQALATSPTPAAELADLPRERQREVFFQLPPTVRQSVVDDMDREQLRRFVRWLDPDEATDVLGLVDEATQQAVLRDVDADRRERIEFLLGFAPETAAGLMHLDYVTVDRARSVAEVAGRVRRFEERTGRFPTVLVTADEALLGELPGSTLALADREAGDLADHVRETPTVRYDRPDDDVLAVFRTNPGRKVAVLDEDGGVLGVIYADDVVAAETGERLYEFTGVAEEESVLDGPLVKVRRRYKWLVVNLGTAFLAAAVVGLFEETIAAFTLLAVYMPVVAGMGGNAGTQAMAVTVRGLALDQVSLRTGGRVVRNEVIAGGANGLINGVLVAVVATGVNRSPLLGLVVGTSMVLNLVIAGFFGALIPLALKRLDLDPATSATIFITTATDVLGFLVFLGLASLVV